MLTFGTPEKSGLKQTGKESTELPERRRDIDTVCKRSTLRPRISRSRKRGSEQ